MEDSYKTLAKMVTGIYKEKGSKFLAYAHPIMCKDDVKPIVDAYKKEFYDARHHCYAWRLGMDDSHFRANDDGEPSGTAGRPILGQLLSAELRNVLVVVVRYFGGIKLGTPGLINAYKTATADAINNAEQEGLIITKQVEDIFEVTFAYEVMNNVMRIMKEENTQILSQDFNNMCTIRFSQRQSLSAKVTERLSKVETANIQLL